VGLVVLEGIGAIGHEKVAVTIQIEGRAEALYEESRFTAIFSPPPTGSEYRTIYAPEKCRACAFTPRVGNCDAPLLIRKSANMAVFQPNS